MKLHHRLALAVVLLGASLASAESYYLPMQGHLHLAAPDGWKASYQAAKGSWDQPVVRFERAAGENPSFMTLTPLPPDGTKIPGDKEVEFLTTSYANFYWQRSTDRNFAQEELKAAAVYGRFCHFEFKKPEKDFRTHVTFGLIRLDKTLIRAVISYDGKDNPDRAAAMEFLKTATFDPAAPVQMLTLGNAYRISVDGRWKVIDEKTDAGKTVKELQATDEARGWTVVIRNEHAQPKPADATGSDHDRVRAHALQSLRAGGAKLDGLKESTVAYCSVAEWDNGAEKHALSCYAADGTWMSVRLVKANYDEKADRATLDELLNSILAKRETPLPGKKTSGGGKKKI